MPFVDKELQKLAQDIINRAVQRQTVLTSPTGQPPPLNMVEKLRKSVFKQTQLPRIY